MLKTSDMARLANTTRRILIFYDKQAIFKPIEKSEAGYRYYDYNQLYDLMFILGLRNLGLSLDEIKAIKSKSEDISARQLQHVQTRIESKINDLLHIQKVISQKISQQRVVDEASLYQPTVEQRITTSFWCSRQSVACTEEEVAQLFSAFYKQLDSLALMDVSTSGFLTELSVTNPSGYADASFRIIKEKVDQSNQVFIPIIEKEANKYVSVLVENNLVGINQGLTMLRTFCQKNNLKTQDYLWQINAGDTIIETGASKYGWLEYAIINETN